MVRRWHLTVLRFAVTRDNADRLGVLAVANEIDRLGMRQGKSAHFGFFRKTSSKLCAAILQQDDAAEAILRQYLLQIDSVRLKRALTAALELEHTAPATEKRPSRPVPSLWRGLPSRSNIRP
jgi:hypothetical protein